MNLFSDIETYIRRIVKTPSNASLSSSLIADYVNRFMLLDVDARVQLFDYKTKYQFETIPGISDYNMPLYATQSSSLQSAISPFPAYQGFMTPCFANGIKIPFYTLRDTFWNTWPNYIQPLSQVATGDGSTTTFQFNLPFFPAIPGHVDMTGIIASGVTTPSVLNGGPIFSTTLNISIPPTSVYPGVFITFTDASGQNVTIVDSGQFLSSGTTGELYGLLMVQGSAGGVNTSLGTYSTTSNTVNYNTGVVNVTMPSPVPSGTPIQAQCYFFQQGIPRSILFFNNTITIRPPPNTQYLIEMDAYLTPAAFLSTSQALPFAYMSEYIARGAARKILSDTGDIEQFQFYEPLFREQEILVWKRSQRINTSTRTPTIYSDLAGQSPSNNMGQGGV